MRKKAFSNFDPFSFLPNPEFDGIRDRGSPNLFSESIVPTSRRTGACFTSSSNVTPTWICGHVSLDRWSCELFGEVLQLHF